MTKMHHMDHLLMDSAVHRERIFETVGIQALGSMDNRE